VATANRLLAVVLSRYLKLGNSKLSIALLNMAN